MSSVSLEIYYLFHVVWIRWGYILPLRVSFQWVFYAFTKIWPDHNIIIRYSVLKLSGKQLAYSIKLFTLFLVFFNFSGWWVHSSFVFSVNLILVYLCTTLWWICIPDKKIWWRYAQIGTIQYFAVKADAPLLKSK